MNKNRYQDQENKVRFGAADKTATLIGATGLIGGHILEILKSDDYFRNIKVIVRRPVEFNHPKVAVVIIDFSNEEDFRNALSGSDVVFCAIGTTSKKVKGDKIAYRKVDYDIPVNASRYCAETNCHDFVVVSSIGADSKSNNFYLKLKGQVEDVLKDSNIPSVSVFRPSLLLGKRKEFRFGEKLSKIFVKPFSFLFPSKYRPVKAFDVARSMVIASKKELKGYHIFHYREMKDLISESS